MLELSILHKECSCRIGADLTYNPNPMITASNNENMVRPNMILRAKTSLKIRYFVWSTNGIVSLVKKFPPSFIRFPVSNLKVQIRSVLKRLNCIFVLYKPIGHYYNDLLVRMIVKRPSLKLKYRLLSKSAIDMTEKKYH